MIREAGVSARKVIIYNDTLYCIFGRLALDVVGWVHCIYMLTDHMHSQTISGTSATYIAFMFVYFCSCPGWNYCQI